jgi:hypothetical protein
MSWQRDRWSRCAATLPLLFWIAGSAGADDRDLDGVVDAADNCLTVANSSQRDSDRDGFGNDCDADFDADGIVDFDDWVAVERSLGATLGSPLYREELDVEGDGVIGIPDHTAVAIAFGERPGPSGLGCAGLTPCGPHVVVLHPPEEVLGASVRLTWTPSEAMRSYLVQRRVGSGSWTNIASLRGRDTAFVDEGVPGWGLPPGRYEYRIRGNGDWSESRAISLPGECTGQPAPDRRLPLVEIVDSEPDGDYDGADVEAALAACSALGGCVLQGLPVAYEDVNVELSGASGLDFPKGLVVQGFGSATVFRSRVYGAADHRPDSCVDEPGPAPALCYLPDPVFLVWRSGAIRLPNVRFRNFTIEGRKGEQPFPGAPEHRWQHWGINVDSPSGASTDGGCIHNVTARELMTGGFALRDARGWLVEHGTVEDVGCQTDLTRCAALEALAPDAADVPGRQSSGFGVLLASGTAASIVRHNVVVRATKYGIGIVEDPATGFHVHDNTVIRGGGSGIHCRGCRDGVIERNGVAWMHYPSGRNAAWPDGFRGDLAKGIGCTGSAERVAIRENVVRLSAGTGIELKCTGAGITVERNLVQANCRVHGMSIHVHDGRGVALLDNTVADHPQGCLYTLLVTRSSDVRVEGGSFRSGPGTIFGMYATGSEQPGATLRGLVLRDVSFLGAGSAGPGLRFGDLTRSGTVYDSVCVLGYDETAFDPTGNVDLWVRDPLHPSCRRP